MRCRGCIVGGGEQPVFRVLGIIAAFVIVIWIISNPAAAGSTVHGWYSGILTFFHHLL
jgi:hypothetical protein